MSSEITALCCCGALDCTDWQNCRPPSYQISGNMIRQYGVIHTNQGVGFRMKETIVTVVFNVTMTKRLTAPFGMIGTAGSFSFRAEEKTYLYHGTYGEPNCWDCLTRYLQLHRIATATANTISNAEINCVSPCYPETEIFSVFQASLIASYRYEVRSYYEVGSPSVNTTFVNSGVMPVITLSGAKGCLTASTFDQYNLSVSTNIGSHRFYEPICAEFPSESPHICTPVRLNPNGIFVDEGCEYTICADDHHCYLASPPRGCGCVDLYPNHAYEPNDGSRNNNLGVSVEKSFIDMYSTVTATL